MILSTTEHIRGREYEIISIVEGTTVKSKHIGKDFLSGLKGIVGGELDAYKEMMDEARDVAKSRMLDQAEKLEADAVVSIRYATSNIVQGASEVMVYGTAVKFV